MDSFACETNRSVAIPAIPCPAASDTPSAGSPSPSRSSDLERLRAAAASEASTWKPSGQRGRRRALKPLRQEWRQASVSIQRACDQLREISRVGQTCADESPWLLENMRMLQAAILETRESLKNLGTLPHIERDGFPLVPRAYAAAASYLRVANFVFREDSFLEYFTAAQESGPFGPFEIGELCALRPLLQLVLLEAIGRAAELLTQDRLGPAKGGQDRGPKPAAERGTSRDRGYSQMPATASSAPGLAALITSVREIDSADWSELFERLSEVDRILREDPVYPAMDSEGRNGYRQAVQKLAAHSEATEWEVAKMAIALAREAQNEWTSDSRLKERRVHVGFYLIDKGKALLKRMIRHRPSIGEQMVETILNWPEVFYFVGIELLTIAIVGFLVNGVGVSLPRFLGIMVLLLPATEAAAGLVNQLVAFLLPPRVLPKLDFSKGIPSDFTTMVVVPTLLIGEDQVLQAARDLEIRYLANRDANLHFALLTDLLDSSQPLDEGAHLVELCSTLIERLNDQYRSQGMGSFFLFHRHRVYNPSERTWMGWERKRGKLIDFNNLLRQGEDSFPIKTGDLSVLPRIRYVITLDSDTQLPRGEAHRMVGTLAHPLNRAVVDPVTKTVFEGYGVLQPRVAIGVHSTSRSRLANVYSGQTGFDIYTRATSDVYQDLFGEGSFTGKGIYEVDVFQQVLARRFPSNAILSHDLIEGTYARAGLVTDIEVIDDYPSHFSAYSRRKHRWVRGDWQVMLWLLPRVPDYDGKMVPNPLSLISRWKILDNLRRSLIEIATFCLLLAGWFSPRCHPVRWTVAALVLTLLPAYLHLVLSLLRIGRAKNVAGFLKETAVAFVDGQLNVFFMLAFLAHQTLVMLDAIVRTLIRLTITRRKLLEWETAAQAELGLPGSGIKKKTPVDTYLDWTPYLSAVIGLLLALRRPQALPVALPFLVTWSCSKLLSAWLNKPLRSGSTRITLDDESFLRTAALRTWRFFTRFSTNGLVPDNVQESPPVTHYGVSPTNLGLLLNARLAACELGYLTAGEFADLTERTFSALRQMPKSNGHLLNWYDARTLAPLEPLLVSTVDSGNLACCLWTLKQGCLQIIDGPLFPKALWQGLRDHVRLLNELAASETSMQALTPPIEELGEDDSRWIDALPRLERAVIDLKRAGSASAMEPAEELEGWVSETIERLKQVRDLVDRLAPWLLSEYHELTRHLGPEVRKVAQGVTLQSIEEFLIYLEAKLGELSEDEAVATADRAAAASLRERLPACREAAQNLAQRLRSLAAEADAFVQEMDFSLLYNKRRKVLSIGYDPVRQRLEPSCYELLASEARTAAFVAIAKGDVPQESWFHLGRAHTARGREPVLLSWTGTMFEYLMPALWMRHYPNTILDQSLRGVVRCQRELGKHLQVPWGISEAAYSARDDQSRYQYQAFGMPPLALKPNPLRDLVVAPYATFLALAIDPREALRNLREMQALGWLGEFGFYESADFAPSRTSPSSACNLVCCWMAHHQGMILLSVCNLISGSRMQELFHAEPRVAATERLLHEKLPLSIPIERNSFEPDQLLAGKVTSVRTTRFRYASQQPSASPSLR